MLRSLNAHIEKFNAGYEHVLDNLANAYVEQCGLTQYCSLRAISRTITPPQRRSVQWQEPRLHWDLAPDWPTT